ncbi:hypothetical protein AGMMS50229_16690 [Campylobacterota bacterium]|nr:hypothetical protein AGMMS50229_16690 [Campylobacterota bacterium]
MILVFSIIYSACAISVAIAASFFGGTLYAINALASAFGSYAVAIASFHAYKKMVLNGAGGAARDAVETIDDPHELYDDQNGDQTPTILDTKPPFATRAKYAANGFSPTRLIGYAVLIACFAVLNVSGNFEPYPFIAGVSALPIAAFIFAAFSDRLGTHFAGKNRRS